MASSMDARYATDHCFEFALPPPQESWAKAAVPMCSFVIHLRDRAVKLVEQMEALERVTLFTFRALEQISHPDDYNVVWRNMDPDNGRPTTARFRSIITEAVRNRNFTYILLHPGLAPSHVHPSRRMFLSLPGPCRGVGEGRHMGR